MIQRTITAEEFDASFDAGSDGIDPHVDWERPIRPLLEQDIDFELDIADTLVERIEVVARRIGTTRAELIRRWLTEKLDEAA